MMQFCGCGLLACGGCGLWGVAFMVGVAFTVSVACRCGLQGTVK